MAVTKKKNSSLENIIKKTLLEARNIHEDEADGDKDEKSIDGDEDGEEEEKDEDKKVKKMKKEQDDDESDPKEDEKEDEKEQDDEDDEDVKEETLAASSLHPAARSIADPKALDGSKVSQMQSMMHIAGSLDSSEWTEFYKKMIDQYGTGKDWGVDDKSGSNQNSIDMKPSNAVSTTGPKTKDPMPTLDDKNNPVGKEEKFKGIYKEDMDAVFDGEDLSEEFKSNVATLFEAALGARMTLESARLEEVYAQRMVSELTTFTENLTNKLDSYLDYVVENFMKENELAIESALRNELMNEFITGLRNLFAEHYISVPEKQIDVVEALTDKVSELEKRLDETIAENTELKNIVTEDAAKNVFEELAADLALTQQEKFAALAEGIDFDGNLDIYAKKLKIIKENYFKKTKVATSTNITEETFEGDTEVVENDPTMNSYLKNLTRTVKK